ncbi:hypothetical protein [Deinococcus planocerae]|uniref:hypothetical protein n=1 Tax=Deinococcus planocerae TaxID=1737569 RepID=UPI0011AF86A0|nr:hypothetical protein [Deinococcus planocerae]
MHVPDWIRETNLRELRARVENLPLEKLALGRRTYRATAAASVLTWATGLLVVGAFTQWLYQRFGLAFGGVAGLLLLITYAGLYASYLQDGWQKSKSDAPAWSWAWCQVMSRSWLPLVLAATALQLGIYALLILVVALLSGESLASSLRGALLVGGMGAAIYLPVFLANIAGELIRGLLGLLGGTGKRVERPTPNPTFVERLLTPRMASMSLEEHPGGRRPPRACTRAVAAGESAALGASLGQLAGAVA